MIKRTILLILMALVLFACSNDDEQAKTTESTPIYSVVSTPALTAPLPEPADEVVLVVTGNINVTNTDDAAQFDMAMLDQVRTVRYRVMDKQALGVEADFQGVLLSDLLDLLQVGEDATTLHIVALDDYTISIPIEEVRKYPILLATRTNGEPMSVAERGPTRVIYPYGFYSFDETVYDSRWIWNVASIDVR